jgi:hypothetical protein
MSQKPKNTTELSREQAEDLFAARLARILVDQVLEAHKNSPVEMNDAVKMRIKAKIYEKPHETFESLLE